MDNTKLTDERAYFKPFKYPWAYEAFVKSEQMHWLWSEIPMAEDVNDWKNKLNEDEKVFLTHLYRFFTQGDCLSEDTEVLTSEGWVRFPELGYNHRVAEVVYNEFANTFNTNFVTPSRIIEKDYSGPMHILTDARQRTKQQITPNHKIVYTYRNKVYKEEISNTKLYQGKYFHISSEGIGSYNKLTWMDRLKIAFQADGNVKSGVDGSRLGYIPHRFTFRKERKIIRLRHILDNCINYGISYTETIEDTPDGSKQIIFYVKGLQSKLSKTFDWVDISNIGGGWAKEFLEELVHWDGNVSPDNRNYYYNTNKDAADVAQIVALLSGYDFSFYKKEDNRSELFNDVFVLSWSNFTSKPIDSQSINRNKLIVDYTGKVYCVTVPSGMFITRNDNKIAITGNCDIAGAYVKNYLQTFPQPEVRMMLTSFAAREGVHIAAYSYLVETLGMPDTIYNEFLQYKAMADKHSYFENYYNQDDRTIAQQMAVFSAFSEGMQLFSSFIMLINFSRFGLMKGMGQVISWSAADESLHCESMIKLFRTFIKENIHIWTDDFKKQIYNSAREMESLESNFIDLAFGMSDQRDLKKEDVKQFARFLVDRRLLSLGLKPEFKVKKNPLTWAEPMLGLTHTNFFEQRVTDYTKGSLTGSWSDVWGKM